MGSVAENEAIVKALLASVRASPAPPTEFFGCGGLEALWLPKATEDESSSSSPSSSSLLPLARLSFASSPSSSPSLSARLVVGADGARSAVRALSGIRSSPWGRDYGDVTPLKGVVLGGGAQKLRVEVTVRAPQTALDRASDQLSHSSLSWTSARESAGSSASSEARS